MILNRDIVESLTGKVTVKQILHRGEGGRQESAQAKIFPSKALKAGGRGLRGWPGWGGGPRWGPAGHEAELPGHGNAQDACGF